MAELVVGREDADVALADPEVSRRHLALRPVNEGVELEDLGSRNGTFVDERRVEGKLVLTSSAAVRVGQTRFEIDIALPQVTKLRPSGPPPSVEATAQRPLRSPDVTVQRPVASPEVTVQRKVVSPDSPAREPVASPDLTVQRPVASPEVTRQVPGVPPPAPQALAPPAQQPGLKHWLPWIFGGLILAVALAVILSLILK
jgi:hypothetical protein